MIFNKILVGVSGGVDSAVTCLLLKNKGFNICAAFMKNWDLIDEHGKCSGEKDWEDAKAICKKLDIPIIQVNFVKQYWNDVFGNFLEDYKSGLTPNPDILCNKHIKFFSFFNYATNVLKFDCIAMGHYARTSFGPFLEYYNPESNARLLLASDELKDQTFFLSQMPKNTLKKTMFPLGDLKKTQVKEIARIAGLDFVANKRESTGICFVGRRNFQDFIAEYIDSNEGKFIDIDNGKIIGKHDGIHHWTIGQRCKMPGCLKAYFVVRKDVNRNEIYVAPGTQHKSLFTNIVYTAKPYWINEPKFKGSILKCKFRFQHTKPLIDCTVFLSENEDDKKMFVKLNEPLRAISPGQYAVFYKDLECLGNARILNPGPSLNYK